MIVTNKLFGICKKQSMNNYYLFYLIIIYYLTMNLKFILPLLRSNTGDVFKLLSIIEELIIKE